MQASLPRSWDEGHNTFSVHRVQKQELFHYEEQEEYNGQTAEEKILQALHEAYDAQGGQGVRTKVKSQESRIMRDLDGSNYFIHFSRCTDNFFYRPVALTARASDSKSEGWGFESLLACH